MTEDEAKELAAKREKHKSKSLTLKRWAAVHDPVKGWYVALVDNVEAVEQQNYNKAMEDARRSFHSGDLEGFLNASSEGLMARMRFELAQHDQEADD